MRSTSRVTTTLATFLFVSQAPQSEFANFRTFVPAARLAVTR